jgi:hypothetical protein
MLQEYAVAQLVEALRYTPEGRGFDSRRSQSNIISPEQSAFMVI